MYWRLAKASSQEAAVTRKDVGWHGLIETEWSNCRKMTASGDTQETGSVGLRMWRRVVKEFSQVSDQNKSGGASSCPKKSGHFQKVEVLGCNTAFLTIISPGQCVSPSLPPLSQPLLSSLQSFLSPLDMPEFGTLINFRSKSINLIYLPIYTLSALPFHHHHHHHHHQSPKSIIFSFLQILNARQLKQQIWSYTPSHPLFSVILF